MQSLSYPFSRLRVVTARYTRAYFLPHHFIAPWRLEPPSVLNYDVQSYPSQFGVQSHYLFSIWVFRAIISSQFRSSEPPSLFSLAFKATIPSQLRRLELPYLLSQDVQIRFSQFGFQSHYFFSVLALKVSISSEFRRSEPSLFNLAFRATVPSQLRRSELSYLLNYNVQSYPSQFGVQSCYLFLISAFRATVSSKLQRSELSYLLSYDIQSRPSQFGVQSHHLFSIWAFRAIIFFQLGAQSHRSFLVTTFRAAISSQLRCSKSSFTIWRSEPLSLLNFGIQSHHPFLVMRSEPPYLLSYDIQSRPSQFGIQSHIFSLAFRVASPIWHSESLSLQFGIQSHHPIKIGHSLPLFQRSEPHCEHLKLSFSLFMTQSYFFSIQSPELPTQSRFSHL